MPATFAQGTALDHHRARRKRPTRNKDNSSHSDRNKEEDRCHGPTDDQLFPLRPRDNDGSNGLDEREERSKQHAHLERV